MAQNYDVKAILTAEDKTKAGIKSAEGNLSGLSASAKKLGGILAGAFAVSKIIDFGKASVEAAVEAERANRQLEYSIISISKGTKAQVDAINDLATALQKKAGIDGDSLKAGAAQLSTFGLQSKSVVALTKSLADLTVNQNGVNASADQYIGSANNIAKALNGQFGILEKSGIRFTEAQQALILYGTEAEKVSAIQEGLAQNLRETTDTIGQSGEGAMARLKQAIGEIQEAIGTRLLGALATLADKLATFLTTIPSLDEIKQQFNDFFMEIDAKTGLVTMLKDAWQLIVDLWNNDLKPALAELWIALEPFKPILDALAQVFGFILVTAIGAAIMAIKGIIGILVELLTVFTKVMTWIANNVTKIFDEVTTAIAKVIEWVEKLIDKIKQLNVMQGIKNLVGKVTGSRATGGPVTGGAPYLVGENGPELFTPSTAGRITPNNALNGGSIVLNINGNTFMGKEGIAEQIGDSIINALGLRKKLNY